MLFLRLTMKAVFFIFCIFHKICKPKMTIHNVILYVNFWFLGLYIFLKTHDIKINDLHLSRNQLNLTEGPYLKNVPKI